MNRTPIRQGDVILIPVATVPADAQPVQPAGRLVLAEGETSGHEHVIAAPQPHAWSQAPDGRWLPGQLGRFDTARPAGVALLERPARTGDPDRFLEVLTEGGVMLPVVRPDGADAGRHAPVHIPAGAWQVRVQRRFDAGSVRRVAD